MEKDTRVFLEEQELETLLDCAPYRRTRLAMRIEARTSTRAKYTTRIKRGDIFVPDDPDVDIAFLKIRGSKDTTEGDNPIGGSARITWVPDDLRQDIESYCDEEGIEEGEEIIDIGYDWFRENVNKAAEDAAVRTGNEDFRHVTTHDLRAFYATHMVKRLRVNKEVVMDMGDWSSRKAIEPYLEKSQPKDIQDALARAGVLQKDVSPPPRQDQLASIFEQLKEIRKALAVEEATEIQGLTVEKLDQIMEEETSLTDDDDPETEQTSLSRIDDSGKINSLFPPFSVIEPVRRAFTTRLHREWTDFMGGDAGLPGPKKAAAGAVIAGLFFLGFGMNLAAAGVALDPSTFHLSGSHSEKMALLLGLVLGTIQILWSDYRARRRTTGSLL